MLDKFLEVSYGHTKEASERAELVQLLTDLPIAKLTKLASGEEVLTPTQDWLSQFQGTGLYDNALLLEQASIQTMDKHAQDEIGVRKLLLEQKLAGELPPALAAKKIPKGSDADNDGKTNEPSIVEKKEAAARRSLRDVEHATVEHYKARGKKKGTSAGAKGGGKVGLGLGALGGATGGFAAGLKGKGGKGALARAGLGALAGGAAGAAGGVAYGAGKGRKKGEQVGERFGKAVNAQRRKALAIELIRRRMAQWAEDQSARQGHLSQASKSKKASVEDVEKIAREFAQADFEKMANLATGQAAGLAMLAGLGGLGYHRGKRQRQKGEDTPKWGVGKTVGSVLFYPYGAYQIGRSLGHAPAEGERIEGEKGKKASKDKTSAVHQLALYKLASGVSYGELNAMEKEAIIGRFRGLAKGISKAWKSGGTKGLSHLGAGAKPLKRGKSMASTAAQRRAHEMVGTGAGDFTTRMKNVGGVAKQWAKSNPFHAMGLAAGAAGAAGYAAG